MKPIDFRASSTGLGHEYLKQQKDREAIKAFKESIKLNPNNRRDITMD